MCAGVLASGAGTQAPQQGFHSTGPCLPWGSPRSGFTSCILNLWAQSDVLTQDSEAHSECQAGGRHDSSFHRPPNRQHSHPQLK